MVFPGKRGRAVAHGERADGRVAVCGPLTHIYKRNVKHALNAESSRIVPVNGVIICARTDQRDATKRSQTSAPALNTHRCFL